MTYKKDYSRDSVRATHKQVHGHGYLFLHFDYAFMESTYDPESGQYKDRYRPFQLSTGITLDKKYWDEDGLSDRFKKDHGARKYSDLLKELESSKKRVFDAYTGLCEELGAKPSPDQIRERLKGKSTKKEARTPLAAYIESLAESRKVRDIKTKKKYRTLANYVRAVEACRKEHPVFRRMAEGSGVMYLSTISQKDWSDLELMVQEVSTDIPRTFVKRGVHAIAFEDKPFYSEATLEKIQANVLAVLRKAKKNPDLNVTIDLDTLDKVTAKSMRKVHLIPEEIQLVLEHRFDRKHSHLENARKLMIAQMLTGVRVSDLPKILQNPIRDVRGRKTTFKAIYLSTKKTGEPICMPLLKPVVDILTGDQRPHMIAEANLNLYYKEVAAAVGLKRIIHTVERKANTKKIDHQDELCTVLKTHDCRRTFFSMLTGYLFTSRLLASKATGHRLSNAQGEDEGYFQLSPEHMAESLLAQILLSRENVPFEIVPDGFVEQWEASKKPRQGRRSQGPQDGMFAE